MNRKHLCVIAMALTLVLNGSSLRAAQSESTEEGKGIAAEVFLRSRAAEMFRSEEYEAAAGEFEAMLRDYPADPLIIRYRAMALDRMGRSEEAVSLLRELLGTHPDHLAARYFLAQALYRSGNREEASREWQKVAAEGKGTVYEAWSNEALARFGDLRLPSVPSRAKRWHVTGRYGYEYDSNVILEPDDNSLAGTRDADAGRQILNAEMRYRVYSGTPGALDFRYAVRQTFHDDSLNEFNFHSEEWGLEGQRTIRVGSKDVTANAGYDVLLGFLDDDIFSLQHQWTLSAAFRPTERTRLVLHDRMAFANFGRDGFDPSRTSRDGFSNDAGVTHYWYGSDFRRFLYGRMEVNTGLARGDNFDTVGGTFRTGLHVPVPGVKADFDGSSGLEMSTFPGYSSISALDTRRRRGMGWDLYAAMTYHLTGSLALVSFYRLIEAYNHSHFFDYERQIGGLQLVYNLSF